MYDEELLDPETVQQLNEATDTGLRTWEEVVTFHQWVVTTVNNDIPIIEDLTENEKYLEYLKNQLYQLCGKITICIALYKNDDPLKNRYYQIEIQIQTNLVPFHQGWSAAKFSFA